MFLRHSVASSSRRAFFAVFIVALICSVSAGVYIYTNLKENDWEKQ